MPVTTVAQEYKRLRSYLNPFIKGPNTDAILTALATGNSSYLINNVRSVNDMLYITTALGDYLDQRLADYGITRPPSVGLSDEVFSQIGIEVKNRKQVRDLINNLLDAIFGDEYTRASNSSGAFEPYNLTDGDTLIVDFDQSNTVTIQFSTNDFENIAAASAQEVADAITKSLRNQGFSGTAIEKDDGNGPYVEILSDTIGPISSVQILGGSAQNQLQFPAVVGAGGNASTQWTLSLQSGGVVRFTWTGGANPQVGKVSAGNYVNIYGGGFASSDNVGSFTITKAVGGAADVAYFEIENPLGTPGIVVQGSDSAVLFYNPVRETIADRTSYAAVYQTQGRVLQIFIPAATKVIRRSRLGSAHLHDAPNGVFTFFAQPNSGDVFAITSTVSLRAGSDFPIGGTLAGTAANFADAVNAAVGGVDAIVGQDTGESVIPPNTTPGNNIVTIWNDSLANTLVITYTGSANVTASGPLGDPTSLQPNQQGPYMYDTTQPFIVSNIGTTLNQNLDGTMSRVIQVDDSSQFPDDIGYLIFGYGTQDQEGPVPYIARPSNSTLLISPSYTIQTAHADGTDVALVAQKAPVSVSADGLNYPFYITDVVSGRVYAQDLINSVAATGINIVFTILYPSDIGLGKWGTIYTENPTIWGE
jgi:hypothetical protein